MASQIYDVEVIGSGSLDGQGRVAASITASVRVEGTLQVGLVMEWVKANGFKASFAPYHGKSAEAAIDKIRMTFARFGVAVPA